MAATPTTLGAENCKTTDRLSRLLLVFGVFTLLGLADCSQEPGSVAPQRVPYSTFEKYLNGNEIESVEIGSDDIEATLRNGQVIVSAQVPDTLATKLEQHGVEFAARPRMGGSSWSWIVWLLPMIILLPLLLMRGGFGAAGGGAAAAITKSNAKVFAETDTKTTFNDVAGVDEAKEELREIVAFLRDPKAYGRLGALCVVMMPGLRGLALRRGAFAANRSEIGRILRLGLPIGGMRGIETGLFMTTGVLMGLLGPSALAAHQLVLNCAGVTFMVPLGLANAATVRVAVQLGAGRPASARRAGLVALALGIAFMSATAILLWTAPGAIIRLYLDIGDPANPPIVGIARNLFAIAALFQVFDGPGDHRRGVAWPQGRDGAAAARRDRLLGRRFRRRLAAGVSARLRRGRAVVGFRAWPGCCCGAADPAPQLDRTPRRPPCPGRRADLRGWASGGLGDSRGGDGVQTTGARARAAERPSSDWNAA
jgi:MatE/FtsH Extracellular